MYTVYLVDDEKWSLVDVMYTCPFAEFGFEVIGQNTNAIKAMDDIMDKKPDVVFADIRMPTMTGLEMIHMVKERLPDTVFVVLSGYAEFDYAAKAIRMGVFDYCLKPMSSDTARELVERLKRYLDKRSVEKAAQQDELFREVEPGGSTQFAALLQYVNDHITEPLVLGDLAQKFFINVSYCGELFKNVTGETFTQYVRKRRMNKACELLRRTSLSMSQIAVRVGYSDLPYFSRIFTAYMGISPSRYRNNVQQNAEGKDGQ